MAALTGNVAVPSAANGFIEAVRAAQAGAVAQPKVNAAAEAQAGAKADAEAGAKQTDKQ